MAASASLRGWTRASPRADDTKVGEHSFQVSEQDGVKQVQSEARVNYKIWFIPAFSYEHSAAEHWTGNCLLAFEASTDVNGTQTRVTGQQSGTGFIVKTSNGREELPRCVMTFAYWNPDFLKQSRLLNPQTGEYVDVKVVRTGEEVLDIRGQLVFADRFSLTADKLDLTLWYSRDNQWLALESVVRGGRIVRYELS
jgi:hypothetical protein